MSMKWEIKGRTKRKREDIGNETNLDYVDHKARLEAAKDRKQKLNQDGF